MSATVQALEVGAGVVAFSLIRLATHRARRRIDSQLERADRATR